MPTLIHNPPTLTKEYIENKLNAFEKDLSTLINQHSLENLSNTPDYILANYLVRCLINYNSIVADRDAWFGNNTSISK